MKRVAAMEKVLERLKKCCAYVMNLTAGALDKDCPVE